MTDFTPEELLAYLQKLDADTRRAVSHDLPLLAGNKAVRMFKDNFQQQGFFGTPWQEVKRRRDPRVRGAAHSRPILTGPTGNLGRSIQSHPADGMVGVVSDLPYASAHNEGTNRAGRGHRTTIPQRQFMGGHQKLTDQLLRLVEREVAKILKP